MHPGDSVADNRAPKTENSSPARPADARWGNQRGAAIVEFALVVVILFAIIFGLIEGGLLVRASNSIRNVVDDAARRGAISGTAARADWTILEQIEGRGALRAAQVNYVVVYRADSADSPPSQACRLGTPVSGECNVYERAEFGLDETSFNCGDAGLDANWCPADRVPDPASLAYVGVLIDATHRGILGIDVDLEAVSVVPIEGTGGA